VEIVGWCFVVSIVGFVSVERTANVERVVVDIAELRFVTGTAELAENFVGMIVVEVVVAGCCLEWR